MLLAGVDQPLRLPQPLIWSDELASILFLWLAMLGAVIAFRSGEHMRMTAIVGMLPPRARAFLDIVAVAAALAFLVLIVQPAYEFAADEVVRHHAGAGDSELLARRRLARRHRR